MSGRLGWLVRHAGRRAPLASLVALPLLTTRPAAAQSAAPPGSAARGEARLPERRVCFRGRPRPRCDAFWLTEVGVYWRAAGTTFRESGVGELGYAYSYEEPDLGSYLAWEAGGMVNRGERDAVGGAVLLGIGEETPRVGLKGRYRRWLDQSGTAVDVGLGVIGANVVQPQFDRDFGTGLTADVSLNAGDYAAVTVRGDAVRGGGRTAGAVYGGVRLGSRPAVIGTAVLGAAYLVLLSILLRSIE